MRKTIPGDILLTLYHTLIEPYLSCCNIVWGSNNSVYLDQLFRKQKKAIRIISNANWIAHTKPLFQSLNLLTLSDINKLQTGCFMYKINHCLLPHFSRICFMLNYNVHDHKTRQSSKLHTFTHRTKLRALSIQIYGVKLWNSLSKELIDDP